MVTNRTTDQHVGRGLCAGGLLVEPEEEAELGAGRAEEELRQPPPVRILGQVQQRRPVWKDVPPSQVPCHKIKKRMRVRVRLAGPPS